MASSSPESPLVAAKLAAWRENGQWRRALWWDRQRLNLQGADLGSSWPTTPLPGPLGRVRLLLPSAEFIHRTSCSSRGPSGRLFDELTTPSVVWFSSVWDAKGVQRVLPLHQHRSFGRSTLAGRDGDGGETINGLSCCVRQSSVVSFTGGTGQQGPCWTQLVVSVGDIPLNSRLLVRLRGNVLGVRPGSFSPLQTCSGAVLSPHDCLGLRESGGEGQHVGLDAQAGGRLCAEIDRGVSFSRRPGI